MEHVGEIAASCLSPILNGNSMGKGETIAPPAIADSARQSQVQQNVRKCANKNGRGKQCPRPAWEGFTKCKECVMANRKSLKKNWPSRMVFMSRVKDKDRGFKWNEEDYIDKHWLGGLAKERGTDCYWCGVACDTYDRKKNTGCTIERLSNKLPHLKRNCVFACLSCNRRSWQKNWDTEPHYMSKVHVDSRLTHAVKIIHDRLKLDIRQHFTRS